MLFLDFWGDNPFTDLELPFPPVPSERVVMQKIGDRITERNNRLRKLSGRKDNKSLEETKKLEEELKDLRAMRKKIAVQVKELTASLPFDTLLAVQPIAPRLFIDKQARCTLIAQAWAELVDDDNSTGLSDTRRRDFKKDFTHNSLLNDLEAVGATNYEGTDHNA